MYSIKKCESQREIDEAIKIFRETLPEDSCVPDKETTFFLARIGDKVIAAIWLRVSGAQAEVGPVAFAGGPAEDGVGIALRRTARDEAVMRGAKRAVLPDGRTESLPSARSYMCKVCGRENMYAPRAGARLKCAGCGYITPADDLADFI